MAKAQYYKQLFSKKNLYFVAAFVVLVTSIIVLLVLLKGQTSDNLKARIFSESSQELSVQVIEKQRDVAEKVLDLNTIPSVDMVIDPKESISKITRYLDEVFASFPGDFVNTNLSFSELRDGEGLAYSEVNLNITSTEDNFFNFLNFVENTGFTGTQESRLMEIRSINMNLNNTTEEDELSYRVVMRIYFQSQKEEVAQTESEQDSSNPFNQF